ncbi:MAG TPA: XRE family transcriptional regulator [Niabella sp.]|nr:XRE family transcriptional regulator [Niabella sp.]
MSVIKEKSLAPEMSNNWNQKKIFLEEEKQNETIGPSLLRHISIAPKIPTEAFKNSDEEEAVIIAILFNGSVFDNAFNYDTIPFNPINKLTQLHEEKIKLYSEC